MEESQYSVDRNSLLENVSVAILIINRQTNTLEYINQRGCDDLNMPCKKLQGTDIRQVFWPEFLPFYKQLLTACADGEEHSRLYYWSEKATWEQITARYLEWEGKPALQLCISLISDASLQDYRFARIMHFDSLLNLPNGNKLEEDINQLASLETVTLIYFKIERFDEINDLYGWDNGDYLLLQVRDWLLKSEPRRGQLYRVNNGFAILGRGVGMEEAKARSEEIQQRFSQPWVLPAAGTQLSVYCTIKIGIVFGKYVRNEMRNLLLRTIRAAGKAENGFSIYDEHTDRRIKEQMKLRNMLIHSVFNHMEGFSINYQPIVDARSHRWVAVEALCRYTTPEGISIPPLRFIHIAEQLGLIEHVDAWVRKTAMRQCVELGLHQKEFLLDLNFSPTQHITDSFIQHLRRTLEETGFPPEKINLEVTESARMTFDEETFAGFAQLRSHGIVLALDDFGTGYSTFENLINLSASFIKTEKLFLDQIEEDAYRQYLLRMIVDLAHHLQMRIVAEGVETASQLSLLQSFKVDFFQGYYFSRPLTFEQLKEQLFQFDTGRTQAAASGQD